MPEGLLYSTPTGELVVSYINRKGEKKQRVVETAQISSDILQMFQEKGKILTSDRMEVEFELDDGQIRRVRRKGHAFIQPQLQEQQFVMVQPKTGPVKEAAGEGSTASQRSVSPPRPVLGSARTPRPQSQPQAATRRSSTDKFHNPYNFVPALPRKVDDPELGDHPPVGHHSYRPDCYSGSIRVRLTTVTPLLLPDAAKAIDLGNDHKSFPVRVDAQGRPYIHPTSLKGMLRSAYEAVTNSRMGVFPGHDRKLAYRMATKAGLSLVPARIERDQFGEHVVLMMGTSSFTPNGPQGPLYAAWLPQYYKGKTATGAVKYPNGQLPNHGDEVQCWVQLVQHHRWDSRRNTHVPDFQYWKVLSIVPSGQPLGSKPAGLPAEQPRPGRSYHKPLPDIEQIKGYVCITKPNIDRKHDERVFFSGTVDKPNSPLRIPLNSNLKKNWDLKKKESWDLKKNWETLILNYQEIHEKEIAKGRKGPPALQHSVWSRHIVGVDGKQKQEATLTHGMLVYAQVEQQQNEWIVHNLFPVNISRTLYDASPSELLDESLRPAVTRAQMSPADRVFGWVNQEGAGAYRGHVRIGQISCLTDNAIEWFTASRTNLYDSAAQQDPGLPLAILGAPKPQQARFYVAQNPQGKAQQPRLPKDETGYQSGKGLRGRKVYPHHANLPKTYWDDPMEDRTDREIEGHFQEYRRPAGDGERDDQNRSVQGWVKINTQFSFDIHVTNLSPVELGALLWLLQLPEGHYHRFGGGKPLGFGSVRLELESVQLANGAAIKTMFSRFEEMDLPVCDVTQLIGDFQRQVQQCYGDGKPFEQVPFIAAFLRMAHGFDDDLPIHYPRVRQGTRTGPVPPHREGKAYEWFVENERTSGQGVVHGWSLPDLTNDGGLPLFTVDRRGRGNQV